MATPVPARQVLITVACLAAIVRLLHVATVMQTPLAEYHLYFKSSDMQMFDRWAERILEGDALGRQTYHPLDDWQLATAPEAQWSEWYGRSPVFYKAPFYPYLLAGLYRLFGRSLLPMVLLQVLVSTFSVVLLYQIGERLYDPASGFLAALFYALYAPAIHYDAVLLRGPWIVLAALLSAWQLLNLRERPGVLRSGALGLTVGFGLIINEGFLSLPLFVAAALASAFGFTRRLATLGGAFLAGFLLVLSPVVIRNLIVGAPAFQLAVTGGTVYCVFNAADANPHFFDVPRDGLAPLLARSGGTLPGAIRACIESFQGDVFGFLLFYLRKALGLIVPYENPDNVSFYYAGLKSPLLRFLPNYSLLLPLAILGLALAGRRLQRLACLVPAAASLLVSILITLPLSRYRAAFAALLFPLAGLAAATVVGWLGERRIRRAAVVVAGIALTGPATRLVQEAVVFGGRPPGHYYYRPVEFLLSSGIHARHERFGAAAAELLELAAVNPDAPIRTGALLGAAWHLARTGNAKGAGAALERLVADYSDDPNALLSAGDSYRDLLHDTERALQCYRTASARHPGDPLAEELRRRIDALTRSGTRFE